MHRNKLTEHLLGIEIDIRFVSIREAVSAGIEGEPALIEAALHCPALLAVEGERDLVVLANALREALLAMGAKRGVAEVVSLFDVKNMKLTNNQAIDELRTLLLPVAAAHGCWLEVMDRRGTGVVGINWRCEDGGIGWQQIEWVDDLDDLDGVEALALARAMLTPDLA